ncbi:MAG: choice-of-anchor I family protein, partial [Pikeienuella sp.]|uniref:choice-of-anchor I family protein n=1 Tax=Pikeienuella sp. TaxID=2831957 RepID=UPI00391B4828
MNAFINEFHYDNDGADAGEFIEVAGPAGTDLTGWSIVLYNGSNGSAYDTFMLSGEIPNLSNGFGALAFPRAAIQNGAPDGFALVDDAGAVIEFLSYEGAFTAVGGPADGMTSTDVGVSEASNSPVGFSLQRAGTGTEAADFTFQPSQAETPGAVNTGQTFAAPGTFDLQITEIWPGNEPGANLTEDWFEVTNFGTVAWTIADGALFFDDESAAPGDADMLMGVTEIAPGESVVFVDDASADEFRAIWGAVIELGQVGTYAGAGLGQGGDAVALFLDDEGDGVDAGDLIDLEAYPDAEGDGGQSYEVGPGDFSSDADNFGEADTDGVATTNARNDENQPAIGSPTDGVVFTQQVAVSAFTLEILHVTDQEASSGAVFDAPRLSAVMNALEAQDLGNDGIADNTLRLSSGDAILPGLFFQASAAVFGVAGLADMIIQNELGFDAIAFGNHEFDFGSGFIADLIDGTFDLDGNPATPETPASYSFEGVPDFMGTDFPYLSSNLDFSTEPSLAPLEVPGGGAPMPNTVTSSVVFEMSGELVGVVGATTPTIDFISSPGLLGVLPEDFDSAPTPEQIDALAAIIQAEVDSLLAANPTMNKVILLAHMQQISIEQELAKRLTDVDIIVAGGSNTRLLDETDRLRDGDTAQGVYPLVETNAGGTQTLIVNTDGSYKYIGRLVIDFDAEGNIIAESYDAEISGAYATDDAGVAALGAEGLIDPEIQAVADLIGAQIELTEGNVFGVSDVYLAGLRPEVRQQETNLGNLTADANLFEAKKADASVLVSIKNGGGIRDDIGQIIVPAGGTEAVRIPNEEILDGEGNVIKPEGGISQNDIIGALRFNNSLTIVTLTGEELRAVLEHGVAASTYDENGGVNQQGRFPQVAGVSFSFDPDLPGGARIVNAAILGDDGEVLIELVRDGETVSPDTPIRVVTLGFLADGGDGYPFPEGGGADRVNLAEAGVRSGEATFADDGTEQDAFAEFLLANFLNTPFAEADTPLSEDTRIQNLNFRADAVFGEVIEGPQIVISEIMYNPASAEDDWEWIEIVNVGSEAIDTSGWVLDDGNNAFHSAANVGGGLIEAGASAVLYNADDVTAEEFLAAWGPGLNLIAVTNWSALALNNGGDIVGLWSSFAEYQGDETTFANVIDVVDYNPIGNLDDGNGSIFLTDLAADNNDTANWALSTIGGETPVGTGRVSEAEAGNSGADVGSPGGDPAVTPDGAPDPLNELSIALAGTITLGGAEIVDFDAATGRAFVTSGGGLIVVDASDLSNLTVETTLAATDFGFATDDVTSVSVRNGIVAVALPAAVVTDNGQVLFFSAETLELLGSVDVGPLPDAVKFNAAGTHLVVSNEGQSAGSDNEPDALPNPEGSVSIVALNLEDLSASTVTTLGFTDASITAEALEAKGVRINPSAPSVAADIEPEFATIVGNTAYIALQENNAVAVIEDITNPTAFTIDSILPLGLKDHSVVNQGLDASNQDSAINIANYDIFGIFQPDGMDSYEVGGVRYFLTANEGDTRGVDEARGAQLVDGNLANGEVDPDIGAELLAQLADNTQLGRLLFSTVDGDTDGDGDIDVLHSFGARSFSIFDENGTLVFDSGDDFEQITAVQVPGNFNGNQNASSFDSRSDDKGPEPEAVVLGEIDGKTYAFIGLERVGGVMVYDVTNPAAPVFEQYLQTPGDFGPEGLRFITAEESPTGNPLLAISSEVSNTLSFYEIDLEEAEITLISAIQGSSAGVTQVGVDDRAALEGQIVIIEAI